MPIPTDTLWNISRLNRIFAISAVVLVGVTLWSILQDYNKQWRAPQRNGKVWEAALVDERIEQQLTPEKRARLDELQKRINEKETRILQQDQHGKQLQSRIIELENERAALDFSLNIDKSNLTVFETRRQTALATANDRLAGELEGKIAPIAARVAEGSEKLAELTNRIADLRRELNEKSADIETLTRQRNELAGDIELMRKKLLSLQPQGLLANLSRHLRQAPLMQFINPAEKVQQIVLPDILTDVSFLRITTIDRCVSCHVNISNRDFTEKNILAYLEEQVATTRGYSLPAVAGTRSADAVATADHPGPVAMPEFWHNWAVAALPASGRMAGGNNNRINSLFGQIGKAVTVTWDNQPIESLKYDPGADAAEQDRQNEILLQIINAWLRFNPGVPAGSPAMANSARATVTVSPDVADRTVAAQRTAAMKYIEVTARHLERSLTETEMPHLRDRYRHALIRDEALVAARKARGLPQLDPSPVMLAHPRLDFYVNVDSPHSMESVGCTSCHDGSGQETDFVLAAHTPRPIWVDSSTGEPVLPRQIITPPTDHHPATMSDMLEVIFPKGDVIPAAASAPHVQLKDTADSAHPITPTAATPPVDYIDPATGKTARAVAQAKLWQDRYEGESPSNFADVAHYWDWPMRPAQYIEANCVRCHTNVYDIREQAPIVHQGRTLFVELGCAGCHAVDNLPEYEKRLVGPDLRHVNAKLSREFINSWIWSPRSFRPSTTMPHFFMLENNSSDEEIRRTRQEVRAITEYLVASATPLPPKHSLPPGVQGNVEDGRTIFNTIGCLGCHSNLNETGEAWITTDLQKRAGFNAETARAAFGAMTYNERQLYAAEHLGATGGLDAIPRYDDGDGSPANPGTPRPIFMHHGPELSAIGDKLLTARSPEQARAWLFDWLKEPRHYSAVTVMPQLRLDDRQAMDLVEYLLAQRRSNIPTTSPETGTTPDAWQPALFAEDPAKLAELTAFFLRSRFSHAVADQKAVDPVELQTLATDALTTPTVPRAQAAAIAEKMTLQQRQMMFLGKKLIGHYGCMSCHAINGLEDMANPGTNLSDWGQKTLDKLDFAFLDGHKALPETTAIPMVNGVSAGAARLGEEMDAREWGRPVARTVDTGWPHVDHNRNAWLEQKLRNTRIYDRGKSLLEPRRSTHADGSPKLVPFTDASGRTADYPELADRGKPYDKLKMPTFYLNDEQVRALVTYVTSNRDPLVSPGLLARSMDQQSRLIAHGRAVAERFNCVSCHQIEENIPAIQQYFTETEIGTRAPPSLRGEGNKIQHAWLFNFLRNVETIRPLPVIRMPSFALTDEETTALVAYFAAASNRESQALNQILDPIQRYLAAEKAKAVGEYALLRAGDDWFLQPALAGAAETLRQWALDHRQMTATEFRRDVNSDDDLVKSHKTLLFKAMFTAALYDAPYPFVESSRTAIDQERFALGEEFFHSMQCLQCHVMGDPSAPGARTDATAPNLSLTQARLQQRWVRNWVQEPAIIQTGTAMPPFFTGSDVFDLHGQSWPRAQKLPPEQIAAIEARYGKTIDAQTHLLLDFLHAAGARGHTSVQPQVIPLTALPEPSLETIERIKKELAPPEPPAPPETSADAMPPVAVAPSGATPAPPTAAPLGTASIAGRVVLKGTPPEPTALAMDAACGAHHADVVLDPTVTVGPNGELANVVVSIASGIPEEGYAPPSEPAVLDQNGCMYSPHILTVMVGQKILIRNSDPFMHNVHGFPQIRPTFNFAQPNIDPGREIEPFRVPETVHVKCDVHPWMNAYMIAFPHPFHAVSTPEGAFTINKLPPGEYTVRAWHEKYGTIEQSITVPESRKVSLDLSFEAK